MSAKLDRSGIARRFEKEASVVVIVESFAVAREAGDAAPGAGLPIVGDFLRQNPRRHFHVEVAGQTEYERLVHRAKLCQLFAGMHLVSNLKTRLRQHSAEPLEFGAPQ